MELDFLFLFQRENIASIDLINLTSPRCFKKRSFEELKKKNRLNNKSKASSSPLPLLSPQTFILFRTIIK